MNTYISLCAAAALSLSLPLSASAKEKSEDVYISDNELQRVSVTWVEPKSYTDVRDANSSRTKFRRHVFTQLEKHIDELAEDLPAGQTLNVTVTNVDLAGRIEPASFVGFSNSMQDIRVMRNIDIPRIEFSYELVDADGTVIKSEEVNLKDMSYLNGIGISGRNKPFEYEKRMLSDWFAKSIVEDKA
ncbi:hypothetical protein GPUN_2554 [Glaciecola punicea ACAM 611]|jgi:hypothetical protein|uniref:DUF3016 domain-containing protein n=1 Tax=Glaciecola punicea ACAM 611 TaxID=1121923 RepID=H5TEE2_9ALTE|nr:DUF3016 domain-containing protein [Glaciecola punicea]GAB56669.1 hypothetical protein GPUN_2554 [Glaciecola punicea ACAM 611]